jgi:hypothetical protein
MINRPEMLETFEEIYGTLGDPLDQETWSCWMGIWAVAWRQAEAALFRTIAEAKCPEQG